MSALDFSWTVDGALNSSVPLDASLEQCVHLEAWARSTYGLVLALLSIKLLSYGTYFENIGTWEDAHPI